MNAFGVDWLSAGALDLAPGFQWWRIFTALTLHADQAHLLGNLLFGMVAGSAVSRLLGAGIGWLSILGAAASANVAELLIAPSAHRAIGASTAVFAALGLVTGLAGGEGAGHRRRWYRWAPLIAGVCLLTLLGAGADHVDVLGHLLGFAFGTALGWVYARHRVARSGAERSGAAHAQTLAGACTVLLVCAAWAAALRPPQ
jgi:membrane associated rhomboid family serine protease